MSNPINFYIIPGTSAPEFCYHRDELRLGKDKDEDKNPTDYNGMYHYRIKFNRSEDSTGDSIEGLMSPISDVSLPPHAKQQAGVPDNARYFAYLYPPEQLCQKFKTYDFQQDSEESLSAALFSVCGAFVYFDKKMKVVTVNEVSLWRQKDLKHKLSLAGPVEASSDDVKYMSLLERTQPLKTGMLHECGFVAYGWQRSEDSFGKKYKNGSSSSFNRDVPHGAFIYFHDNGEAVKYLVTRNRPLSQDYRQGYFDSSLTDAISLSRENPEERQKLPIVENGLRFDDFKECKQRVNSFLEKLRSSSDLPTQPENHDILCKALKCKFKLSDIKFIGDQCPELSVNCTDEELKNAHDKSGWNALHYGCRFYAENLEIIEYLVKRFPRLLICKDNFDRYPLHIACDSNPSEPVVQLLLGKNNEGCPLQQMRPRPIQRFLGKKNEESPLQQMTPRPDKLILQKTKRLHLLPIHIACNRGASVEVIRALLDADKEKATIGEKTKVGRLPLHLAVGKKLSYEVIEALLEAEKHLEANASGIYKYFRGLLPLHIACLSEGIDSAIVELLVDHDTCNGEKTFFMETNEEELPESLKFLRNFRALHLCLFSSEMDSAKLLLRREERWYNKNADVQQMTDRVQQMTERAGQRDVDRRTCLHLACRNNAGSCIIKILLRLDPEKKAVIAKDRNGSTPLHLACNQKYACKATIELLLKAMQGMSGEGGTSYPRPQKNLDILGRNPFSLAVKSKAPSDVLELLLQPEYFDIGGFGDREINELARRIKKEEALQKALNLLLSQRLPFGVYYLNCIVNVGIFVMFFYGCETILQNDGGAVKNSAFIFWYNIFVLLLLGREILQLRSEKWHYLTDIQSAFELTSIGLLSTSLDIFMDGKHQASSTQETILIFATSILVINLIFFLRNTCLPFSRFAGGLMVILWTLVPFFLVSCLLLFMFSHLMRLTLNNAGDDIEEGSLREMCAPTQNATEFSKQRECFLGVMNAFFGGSTDVETRNVLDIAFGAVVLLVLLNVNIAIVSNAWNEAKDHATDIFWRGRLAFLGEIRGCMNMKCCFSYSWFDGLAKWIDSIEGVSFQGPKCSWSNDHPYNMVWTIEEYEDPQKYFTREIAATIKKARSISSDMYWHHRVKGNGEDQYEEQGGNQNANQRSRKDSFSMQAIILYWVGRLLKFSLFLLAGICSLGILWPQNVRLWIVSLGCSFEEDGDSDARKKLEIHQNEIKDVKGFEDFYKQSLANERNKTEDLQQQLFLSKNEIEELIQQLLTNEKKNTEDEKKKTERLQQQLLSSIEQLKDLPQRLLCTGEGENVV